MTFGGSLGLGHGHRHRGLFGCALVCEPYPPVPDDCRLRERGHRHFEIERYNRVREVFRLNWVLDPKYHF